MIVQPLDRIAVGQGRDPHRRTLIVDLGVVPLDLKLGDQIRHLAQLALAELNGGIPVDHRHPVHIDVGAGDILGKITIRHGDQIFIGRGVKERRTDHRCGDHQKNHRSDRYRGDLQHLCRRFDRSGTGARPRERNAFAVFYIHPPKEVQQIGKGVHRETDHHRRDQENPKGGAAGIQRRQSEPKKQENQHRAQQYPQR